MTTLFGIKNCDTVKKAQKWLANQHVDVQFHDFRVDGIDQTWLMALLAQLPESAVVNKKSTTYRQLDEQQKSASGAALIALLLAQPTLIKRPVLHHNDQFYVGFAADHYQTLFAK